MNNTNTTKQAILVPLDLNVDYQGKMLSQAGHAVQLQLFSNSIFKKEQGWFIPYDVRLETWFAEDYPKITLAVESTEKMLEIYHQAEVRNMYRSLVIDNGHTEFNGQKTITCAVIGPDYNEVMDSLTGTLKLFRKFPKK
jgi:peptidyl-tRNA hydrolase, PTH2 family